MPDDGSQPMKLWESRGVGVGQQVGAEAVDAVVQNDGVGRDREQATWSNVLAVPEMHGWGRRRLRLSVEPSPREEGK